MRRRALLLTAILAVAAALLAGCDGPSTAGPLVTQERDVAGATAVTLAGVGRLILSTGPTPSLTVTAGEGIIDRITSEVDDGVLTLDVRTGPTLGFSDIRYDLVLPQVDALTVAGAGDVDATLAAAEALDVRISGAGDVDATGVSVERLGVTVTGTGSVTLTGSADRQDVEISGVGSYDGTQLKSRDAEVLVSGTGSANVLVSEALRANVSGTGSITYAGGAEVTTSVTGLGSVRERT